MSNSRFQPLTAEQMKVMDEEEVPVAVQAKSALAAMTQEELTEIGPSTYSVSDAARIKYMREHALEIFQREQIADKLAAHKRLGGIRDVSLAGIEERLAKGDAIINGEGEIVGYRPVRLRELDNLLASVIDRQIALEKRILGEADTTTSPSIDIEELAKRLRRMAIEEKVVGEVKGDYHGPE